MKKKPDDTEENRDKEPKKGPNRFSVCANSIDTSVHNKAVAVPLKKDRKGFYYSTCFCGARTFHGRLFRKGLTYEEVLRRGLQPIANA